MKALNITADNFGTIRETLKNGESCQVNNIVTLVSFVANTEKVNASGKKTRTPFYYVTDKKVQLTSTQLKTKLGIETETKGVRKETTFASVWEQASKLAKDASTEELQEAIKTLRQIIDERALQAEKEEAAKKEAAAKVLGFASYAEFEKAQKKQTNKKK